MRVLAVRKSMCPTCPFREGSELSNLADGFKENALIESRICHSTGGNRIIIDNPKGKSQICRGARDYQLKALVGMRMLLEPTDEAFTKRSKELGAI